jgi:NADH-quinone oxidoreductase subunit M
MTAGAFILPLILGLPLLGAILVMLIPKEEAELCRGFGLAFSIATFFTSLLIFAYFKNDVGGYQLLVEKDWIPGLNAEFKVGIDGISLWLVILTTFLTPITMYSASSAITKNVREFTATMLILEVGMLGAFLALDVFLFYVFWEVMLIPMYLLIGIWGGHRRIYASIKFVIYTMVGSLLMLGAILFVYAKYGAWTGEYTTDLELLKTLPLSESTQIWCFCAFALAFAIKIPLFPLHTWLPDAHVEAPTAGSVILAGVLLKFGIYGFIRFAIPMFPHAAFVASPYIAILAVVGIIYGALTAFAQDDVKKLVAYSSVSHLGFCALGLFALTPEGIQGSIFAMVSHGLTTGGLFLGIGVLYERRHTRRLAEFGGVWKTMPIFAGLYLIIVLGSAGLPGTSGFVGEFLTLIGTFTTSDFTMPMPKVMAAFAATGVILGAVYLLYMFQKVFFGPITNERNAKLRDLNGRELFVFIMLVIPIIGLGVYPGPVLKSMEKSTQDFRANYMQRVSEPAPAADPGKPGIAVTAAPTANDAAAELEALGAKAKDLEERAGKLAERANAINNKPRAIKPNVVNRTRPPGADPGATRGTPTPARPTPARPPQAGANP